MATRHSNNPDCRVVSESEIKRDFPSTRTIELTDGSSSVVDAFNYEWLSQIDWHPFLGYKGVVYAKAGNLLTLRGKSLLMHRLIMDAKRGELVDHRNRNGLDNRKENLRTCTYSQNNANSISTTGSSKYKGVTWNKVSRQWRSEIRCMVDGASKTISLGYYDIEEDAALAYDRAAVIRHGEFARLNFPGMDDDRILQRRVRGELRPETVPRVKLSVEQKMEILGLLASGESPEQIGLKFKITDRRVRRIKMELRSAGILKNLPPLLPRNPPEGAESC